MGMLLVILGVAILGVILVALENVIDTDEMMRTVGVVTLATAGFAFLLWILFLAGAPMSNSKAYYDALYDETQTAETRAIVSKHETMHENFFFNIFYPLKEEK